MPTLTLQVQRTIFSGCCALYLPPALAASCLDIGLARNTAAVMQIREAAQPERVATVYLDAARRAWFVPLLQAPLSSQGGPAQTGRLSCLLDGVTFWKLDATDPSVTHDAATDMLSFIDTRRATDVLEGRKAVKQADIEALDSVGVNYQLSLNYVSSRSGGGSGGSFGGSSNRRLNPSTLADFYGYSGGWYGSTTLGWSDTAGLLRYQTYALKESIDSGTFLRLGDAISKPTAIGESLQFAGLSWGTDRNLRPGDYAPVLPTLRNGNVLAGPLEVFINDTLQFQQTLQSGVYDLRNLPAQQGFNSYSVRTVDAQGNTVTVVREIYLPTALLPPGISSWSLDAGFRREDALSSSTRYGAPFVAGSYVRGLSHGTTLGGQALVSKAASTAGLEVDQRLTDLWTAHLGLLVARNTQQQGEALQARIEGGSRFWQIRADWTQAGRPLPGLGSRSALVMQRLLRAQVGGFAGWNVAFTAVQSEREQQPRENIASVVASTRLSGSGASLAVGITQTRASTVEQKTVTVSVFLPLDPAADHSNRSLYASYNNVDGIALSRAQYNHSGQTQRDASWNVGATHDARQSFSSLDGAWVGSTDRMDLNASGRVGQDDYSGQLTLRSGLIRTAGAVFATRPINGSFAMVSTGEEGVKVFYENRPAGQTNERGLLLVPDLRALETNRITLDPANWPIHWVASDVERQVIPPRGGGVMVSFKINAQVWPAQTLITPLAPDGKTFPSGTVVVAAPAADKRESVIDRRGQLWIAELLPSTHFEIMHGGKRCIFNMPPAQAGSESAAEPVRVKPVQCEDQP